jgi:hypothetical protein
VAAIVTKKFSGKRLFTFRVSEEGDYRSRPVLSRHHRAKIEKMYLCGVIYGLP